MLIDMHDNLTKKQKVKNFTHKLRFWCYRPISISKVYLHVSVLTNYNLKCCFNCFFDYLNVNFQLLFSQFNNKA